MRDPVKPTFSIPNSGQAIHLTIPQTNAKLANQGYTYNQAGFTYNQAGVQYGGVYLQNQDVMPMVFGAKLTQPMNLFIIDQYTSNVVPPPNNQKIVGPGWWMYVSQ